MSETRTWRQLLKERNITFVSGDVQMLDELDSTDFENAITLSGFLNDIINFAAEHSLYIVPEAQDITWNDGTGRATVTLSPDRMDINVNVTDASGDGGDGVDKLVAGHISYTNMVSNDCNLNAGIITYVEEASYYFYDLRTFTVRHDAAGSIELNNVLNHSVIMINAQDSDLSDLRISSLSLQNAEYLGMLNESVLFGVTGDTFAISISISMGDE